MIWRPVKQFNEWYECTVKVDNAHLTYKDSSLHTRTAPHHTTRGRRPELAGSVGQTNYPGIRWLAATHFTSNRPAFLKMARPPRNYITRPYYLDNLRIPKSCIVKMTLDFQFTFAVTYSDLHGRNWTLAALTVKSTSTCAKH